jgi:hypothetical protein
MSLGEAVDKQRSEEHHLNSVLHYKHQDYTFELEFIRLPCKSAHS